MSARTRREGLVYVLLAAGGTTAAAWMAHRYHLQVAGTITALLPSLGSLYLSWASFRADRAEAAVHPEPAEVADELAVAVRGQWEAEARVRRMNDPYPLPVAWRAAEAELSESWALLRETAVNGPSVVDPSGWAAEPTGLAGEGGQIAEVFLDRVPTRRLLVLGAPGTGKTVLLIRLLLALIGRRTEGGPVPVLFPLASWSPTEQPLDTWMAERLARDYTGLGNPAAVHDGRSSPARTLLEHGLILPVLDGFDEIPRSVRGQALDMINASLAPGQPLVLSSRVAEYRDALAPATGVPVRLAGAAAVELRPLDTEDIAAYLERDAGGQGTAAAVRWEPVVGRLGTSAPVARALSTPLTLFLARTVYNPRPGEHTAALPDPAELCDPVRFPNCTAVRTHLFNAFLPAAYRPHSRYPCRWSPGQAHGAFTYLAQLLDRNLGGTTDLAWWQLHRALPPRAAQLAAGVATGAVAWFTAGVLGRLTALVAGLDSGWLTGPPAGIVAGLAGGIAGGIGCGVVAGLTAGSAEGLTNALATGHADWLLTTTANGLAYGFAGGVVGALSSRLTAHHTGRGPRGRELGAGARSGRELSGTQTAHRGGRGAPSAESRRPEGGRGFGARFALGRALAGGSAARCSRPAGQSRWAWGWRGFGVGLVAGGALWFAFRPVYGAGAALAGAAANAAVYGLAGGVVGARARKLSARRPGPAPAIRTHWTWDWRGFLVGLGSGPAVGITHWAVLRIQAQLTAAPAYTFTDMLSFVCAYALAVGLACGLRGTPADLTTAVGPAALLAQDRRTFRKLWIAVGTAVCGAFLVCYGAGFLLHGGLRYGLTRGLSDPHQLALGPAHILVRGLAYGTTVGLAAALSQTAWWYYAFARQYLALRGRIPRCLTAFLVDAHERRGVLRQVGAVHQFRHIDLQHHLATPSVPTVPRQAESPDQQRERGMSG